jgi:hypothetical protein
MGGISGSKKTKAAVLAAVPEAKPMQEARPAAAVDEEDKAARRRARRGGRSLLSESRLNPEQGVTTLGQPGVM